MDKGKLIGIALLILVLLGSINYLLSLNVDTELPEIPEIPLYVSYPVSDDQSVKLNMGWNIVSMPETMYKYSIIVNYNDNSYTWDEAVDSDLIADGVLDYRGNGYVNVDYLYKTKGYWIFCFVNDIYLSDEPFVVYAGKIMFGDDYGNITCNRIIIAPELYNNTLYVNTLQAIDSYTFYYLGGEVLDG